MIVLFIDIQTKEIDKKLSNINDNIKKIGREAFRHFTVVPSSIGKLGSSFQKGCCFFFGQELDSTLSMNYLTTFQKLNKVKFY